MKITIFHELVYPYSKGGGEVQRFQVARHLANLGYHVTLAGYNFPGSPKVQSVGDVKIVHAGLFPVHAADSRLRRIFDACGLFLTAVKEKYDVMMTNPYFSLPVTLPVAKLRGRPVAVTWDDVFGYETFREQNGAIPGLFGAFVERLCLFLTRYADVVFTVSTATKEKLVKGGISPEKIVIMRNGINPEDYPEMGVKRKQQIVYLGRHIFYKNVDHLLRAFAQIAKGMKLKLIILGEGEMTDSYRKLAKELRIEERVEFCGFVDGREKCRILQESLFLVLPSSYEGFGIALIEANACGTPYIAYDIPAVREVTEITGGGIMVTQKDAEGLAKAMKQLLRNPRLRRKLAENGKENVLKHFTWRDTAETVNRNLIRLAGKTRQNNS